MKVKEINFLAGPRLMCQEIPAEMCMEVAKAHALLISVLQNKGEQFPKNHKHPRYQNTLKKGL